MKKFLCILLILICAIGTVSAKADDCNVSSRSISMSVYYQNHWLLWNPDWVWKRTSEMRASHSIESDTLGHSFPLNMTVKLGSEVYVANLVQSSFSKSWEGANMTGEAVLTSHGGRCSACGTRAASRDAKDASWNWIN